MIEEELSVRESTNVRKYQISHHNNKVTDNGRYISYMLIRLLYRSNQQPFTKKQLKQSFISAFSALGDRINIHSNRVCIIHRDTIQFHYSIDDDDKYYDQDTFDHFITNEKLRHELIKNMHLFLEKRLQFHIDRKEVSLEIEVEYIDDHIHIWIKEDRQKYYIYGHQILDTFQNAGILDVEHISTSETIRNGKIGIKLVVKSPRLLQSGFSIYEWFAIHLIDDIVESQNDIFDLLLDDASDANASDANASDDSGDSADSDDSADSGDSDDNLNKKRKITDIMPLPTERLKKGKN